MIGVHASSEMEGRLVVEGVIQMGRNGSLRLGRVYEDSLDGER